MDPLVTSAIISAGSNLLGGFFGERGASARNDASLEFAREQNALQREMAQFGIRWKVEDAKAAGIHPLFALGAPPFNPSPVSYQPSEPSFGMAEALSRTGQDIGRMIHATRTADERLNSSIDALRVENLGLQNDLLRSQIAKFNSAQVGPPLPGMSSGLGVVPKPHEVTVSELGAPHKEAGYVSDFGLSRTATGYVPVPSGDIKQRIEDNLPHEIMHYLRNNVLPNWDIFGADAAKGTKPNPEIFDSFNGKPVVDWRWNPMFQEWQPVYFSDTWKRIEGR